MPELLTACAGCGRAMNPNAVLYDTQGRPICDTCSQQADLLATDRRAANNIRRAGYLCLATGAASMIAPVAIGFGVAFVVVAAVSGIFALQSFARGNERFTKHLTQTQRRIVWVCVIGGLNLTALSLMGVNAARFLFKW